MADQEWLQQLLRASLHGDRLVCTDVVGVRSLAERRLAGALGELLSEAREACALFNDLRLEARATSGLAKLPVAAGADMRVLPLGNGGTQGLTLLLGACHLALELKGAALEARVSRVVGFQKETRPLYAFEPQFDAFGTLLWAWSVAPGRLLDHEQLVKKLMEDLVLAALKSERGG